MQLRLLAANIVFVIHLMVGAIILFGWTYSPIRPLYLGLLVAWPACWLLFGHCPLSKWEFQLRKKYREDIDINGEILSYYLHRLFGWNVPARFIFAGGIVFLLGSVALNLLYWVRTGSLIG